MKALSVRQPWAWAILNGKDIENRTWRSTYTGPFLIHTGKTFDHEGYQWLLDNCHLLPVDLPSIDDFQMGGIVGIARLVGCVDYHKSPWFFGPVGFVVKDVQPVEFMPWKGKLGFFKVSYEQKNVI